MRPSGRAFALALSLALFLALSLTTLVGCGAGTPQQGVPAGRVFEFTFDQSQVYPGTTRTITVYVPAQYKADKPACVYVGLDGLGFGVPAVFDKLIHNGEMPVTIGIGVSSGTVPTVGSSANPRFNRSLEFDGLNGDLARLLLEEIFPAVEHFTLPGGLPILLSDDPNDRAAGGASAGAIAAFTLAWERPDAFRRVFSAIGTYVGMRGGDRYPVLVRKTEPKPVRIFMQDGSGDGLPDFLDEMGDWWMSNQAMQRALEFAGYEVEHAWGDGGHSDEHATAIFPDAMRWLWKDWPAPVTAGVSRNSFLRDLLLAKEDWRSVPADDRVAREVLADWQRHRTVSPAGNEYSIDPDSGSLFLLSRAGSKSTVDTGLRAPTGVAVSPDGQWLAVAESRTHWGYSYRVQPDGSLQNKQRFYWIHVPDTDDDSGVANWVMDREGHLYAATRLGVQVFDRNGRVRAILPVPGGSAAGIGFGGPALDTLYVSNSSGKLYARKLKVSGVAPGAAAVRLPPLSPG